jgi:D-alanyl-D-alanine dipeptidase
MFRILFVLLLFTISCGVKRDLVLNTDEKTTKIESSEVIIPKKVSTDIEVIVDDTSFVSLKKYDASFMYDMRYATQNNFLKQKVYDCDECYLRLKTVKLLIEANNDFKKLGYTLKLFDCYRPIDIQYKMWEIVSNPDYVANPKTGSMHNRGSAIDVTLVDKNGVELNMGTDFDFFGEQAAHNYIKFSQEIIKNRELLKNIMEKHQFKALNSEWWHYSVIDGGKDKVSNFKWNCN